MLRPSDAYICVGNLGHHCDQAASHYLSQCKKNANRTFRSKLRGKLNRNLCIFMQVKYLKMSSGNWRPLFLDLNMLKWLPVNLLCTSSGIFIFNRYDMFTIYSSHMLASKYISHDDVIKWKHFPRDWPFVRGIHPSPMNSPHKGQWRGALIFSLICAWMNDWVNNR